MSHRAGLDGFWRRENPLSPHQGSEYMVAQLVEALCWKPEGWGFDCQWGSLELFIDLIFLAALWP